MPSIVKLFLAYHIHLLGRYRCAIRWCRRHGPHRSACWMVVNWLPPPTSRNSWPGVAATVVDRRMSATLVMRAAYRCLRSAWVTTQFLLTVSKVKFVAASALVVDCGIDAAASAVMVSLPAVAADDIGPRCLPTIVSPVVQRRGIDVFATLSGAKVLASTKSIS